MNKVTNSNIDFFINFCNGNVSTLLCSPFLCVATLAFASVKRNLWRMVRRRFLEIILLFFRYVITQMSNHSTDS